MARRDVLGRLVVEDGLGRLNCHEQLAPSEQEQVPRSRAAPGVPARELATLASVSLRLPRALATPRAPGHLPHAIAAPRVPRACPRPRALATPRAPGHVPHALAAPRVPRVPCIRQGHAADAGAREAMRTSRDANIPRRAARCCDCCGRVDRSTRDVSGVVKVGSGADFLYYNVELHTVTGSVRVCVCLARTLLNVQRLRKWSVGELALLQFLRWGCRRNLVCRAPCCDASVCICSGQTQ